MLVLGSCYSSVRKEILEEFGFESKVCVDTLIYLLTAIGLTPGGSSTVNVYTQTIHRKTQLILEECRPCPEFASVIPWHLLYN